MAPRPKRPTPDHLDPRHQKIHSFEDAIQSKMKPTLERFLEENKERISEASTFSDKQAFVKKFLESYQRTSGENMLDQYPQSLYPDLFDVLMKQIHTIDDLDDGDADELDELTKQPTGNTELDVMNNSYSSIVKFLNDNNFPSTTKNDFNTKFGTHAHESLKELKEEMNIFFKTQALNKNQEELILEYIDNISFDNSQTVIVNALRKKGEKALQKELDKLVTNRQITIAQATAIIGDFSAACREANAINNLSVRNYIDGYNAFLAAQGPNSLNSILRGAGVDPADFCRRFKDQSLISNKDIFDEYKHNSGLNKENLDALKVGHLQGRDTKIKALFGTMLQKQMVKKFMQQTEASEKTLEHFAGHFAEIGPNFRQIFQTFPYETSDNLIQAQINTKQEKINELTNQLKSDASNKELRKKIRELRNEKEEMRRNAYINFVKTQDNELGNVLERTKNNKFRLDQLNNNDQKILVKAILKNKINEIKASHIGTIFGFSPEDKTLLVDFITDLLDPDKNTVTLKHPKEGDIVLKLKSKKFMQPWGANGLKEIGTFSFENIRDQLPYVIEWDANNMSSSHFQRLTMYLPELFETAKNHLGHTIHLHEGFKVKVDNQHEGYLSIVSPDDDIASQWSDKLRSEVFDINQNKEGVLYFLYSSPLNVPNEKRTLVPNQNTPTILRRLPNGKMIKVNEGGDEECTLDIIDKTVHLSGNNLGALMRAQTLGLAAKTNHRDADKIKEHENKVLPMFKESMQKSNQEDNQDTKEIIGTIPRESRQEQNDENSPETFQNQILDFLNGKGEGSTFFGEKIENIQDITNKEIRRYTKSGSTLPPKEVGKGLVKMKVKQIDPSSKKITLQYHGGDLKLKGDEEGFETTLDLDIKNLKDLCSAIGPAIKVSKNQKPDAHVLNDLITKRSANKAIIDDDALKIWNTGKRNKDKFILNESGEEVTHRGTMESIGAGQLKKVDVPVTYEIKRVGDSYDVIGEKIITDGASKHKEKFYAQKFSPAGLLLFLNTKKLNPLTDKQYQNRYNFVESEKNPNSDALGTTWVGVRHARKAIKGFGKMRREKFEELDKAYDEQAEERVYLHAKIAKKLTRLPFGIGKAFGEVQESKEDEWKDKVLKKVLKHKDRCLGYDSFSDAIKDDIIPYLNGSKGNNRETRIKIAGSLLACLNKGRYPRLGTMVGSDFPGYEPGMWIQKLLGKDHHSKFKTIWQGKILEAKRNPNDTKVYNDVGRGEIEYIIKALRGLADNGHEKDALQAIFGSKLDNEFEKELSTRQNPDEIKKSFDRGKDKYFNDVYFDFFDQMQDGNTHAAIGSLKALGATARNQQEVKDLKMCISIALFSGAFQHETNHVGKGILVGICRKYGFPLGRYFEDEQSRTKGAILFDYITKDMGDNKFSQALSYKADDFSVENYEQNLRIKDGKSFLTKFETRWNQGAGNKICDFFALENFNDKNGKNRLEYLGQRPDLVEGTDPDIQISREEQSVTKEMYEFVVEANKKVDVDEDVFNKHVTAGSALALSPEAVRRFLIINEGRLKGDEKQNDIARNYLAKMEKIFDSAAGSIVTTETFEFLFDRYASIFGGTGGSGDISFFLAGVRNYMTLKNKNDPLADTLLKRIMTIIPEINNRGIPPEMMGVFNAFIKFFKNNISTFNKPQFINKYFKNEELYNQIMNTNGVYPWMDPKKYREVRTDNRQNQKEATGSFNELLMQKLRRANITDINFNTIGGANTANNNEDIFGRRNKENIISGERDRTSRLPSNFPENPRTQNALNNTLGQYNPGGYDPFDDPDNL